MSLAVLRDLARAPDEGGAGGVRGVRGAQTRGREPGAHQPGIAGASHLPQQSRVGWRASARELCARSLQRGGARAPDSEGRQGSSPELNILPKKIEERIFLKF